MQKQLWNQLTNKWFYSPIPKNASTAISKHRIDAKYRKPKEGAIKVVVIRNPFDRLVSCWADKGEAFRARSFVQFIDEVCSTSDEDLDAHAKPQKLWVREEGITLIPFDFVSEFFLAGGLKLERHNQSSHKNFEGYYNPDMERKVIDRFEGDFRLYGDSKKRYNRRFNNF